MITQTEIDNGRDILGCATYRHEIVKWRRIPEEKEDPKKEKMKPPHNIKNYERKPGWFFSPNGMLGDEYGSALSMSSRSAFRSSEVPQCLRDLGVDPPSGEFVVEWNREVASIILAYRNKSEKEKQSFTCSLKPYNQMEKPNYSLCNVFVFDSLYAAGFDLGPLMKAKPNNHYPGPRECKKLHFFFDEIYCYEDPKKKIRGNSENAIRGDVVLFPNWGKNGHMGIISDTKLTPSKKSKRPVLKFWYVDQHDTALRLHPEGMRFNRWNGTYVLRPKSRLRRI